MSRRRRVYCALNDRDYALLDYIASSEGRSRGGLASKIVAHTIQQQRVEDADLAWFSSEWDKLHPEGDVNKWPHPSPSPSLKEDMPF